VANIGKSITIKGDVSGQEDLVIEGHVDGQIDLRSHHLTIGPNGEIQAEISAKQVTIVGRVVGNVTAAERVEICDTGRLEGNVTSPRLLIHEGAVINGTVSMKQTGLGTSAERPAGPGSGTPPRLTDVSKGAS
jgi:cytoskeletal protein CcmA (bactofilin family)